MTMTPKVMGYKSLELLSNELKTTTNCTAATAEGFTVLWTIHKSFHYLDE